jgi:hypothetical protein
MGTSDDALGSLMHAIERIEVALELVDDTVHRMSGIQSELRRKAEACRRLAVGAEDEWRKALWIQRARHWELEAAKIV